MSSYFNTIGNPLFLVFQPEALDECLAAVDLDHFASDKGSLLRCQEDDHVRHFAGVAQPLHQDAVLPALHQGAVSRSVEGSVDGTGRDHVARMPNSARSFARARV